jgi:hypothetical protein
MAHHKLCGFDQLQCKLCDVYYGTYYTLILQFDISIIKLFVKSGKDGTGTPVWLHRE